MCNAFLKFRLTDLAVKSDNLILYYQIDNSPEQTFEIFGYIEPGGTYLYGREGVLTFEAQGTPTIQISTD